MKVVRIIPLILILVMLVATGPGVLPARAGTRVVVTVYQEGQSFCPSRVYRVGNVAVQSGHCYVPTVLRDRRGTFLAFIDPSVSIPQGQLVRLDSSAGRRARTQMYFLVPVKMTRQMNLIPVNTIQLIQLREEDDVDEPDGDNNNNQGNNVRRARLIVLLPVMHNPVLTATFDVRF